MGISMELIRTLYTKMVNREFSNIFIKYVGEPLTNEIKYEIIHKLIEYIDDTSNELDIVFYTSPDKTPVFFCF